MQLSKTLWWILLSTLLVFTACDDDDDDDDLLGNWVEVGAFEGIPRTDAVVFVIGEYAYVGSGYNGEEDERLRDFWRYDAVNDSWREVASLPAEAPARNGAVAFTANGKGYVGTGYDGENKLKDFWEFNPALGDSGQWVQVSDFPGTARYSAIAFGIENKGYVGTGYDGNRLKDFYRFDASTGSWAQIMSIGGSKRRDAAVFVMEGKAYVFTGVDNSEYVTDAWMYDPENDSWTEKREVTSNANDDESYDDDYSLKGSNIAAFSMGGCGYLSTGGAGYAGNSTWEYNPITDFWEEKTNFEGSSRSDAVAFAINGKPYVATGNSSGYYFDDVWTFRPDEEQSDND